MKNYSIQRKSKGFTIIEVIIVLLLIGLLVAAIVPNIRGKKDEAQFKAAELFFSKTMNESLATLFGRLGTVNGVTAARIQATGVTTLSEWGTAWTMASACAAEACTITYPIGGPSAAATDQNGTDLAAKLTRVVGGQATYQHITAAVYNAGADTLAVTLSVR